MGFGNFNIFKAPQEAPKEERKPTAQELHVFNTMQRQLILHYEEDYEKTHGTAIADDDMKRQIDLDWIKKYAPEFSKLRDDLLKENPHLVDDWIEHPDQVSKEIEKEVKMRLYHESEHSDHGSEQAA